MSSKNKERTAARRLDALERALGIKGGDSKPIDQRIGELEFAISEISLSMAAMLRLFVMDQGDVAMRSFERAKDLERQILMGDVEPEVEDPIEATTEPTLIIPTADGGVPEGATVFGG